MRLQLGFTMLELVMASVVFLIAVLGLLSFYRSPFALNEASRDTTLAIQDASQVIEQMRVSSFGSLQTTNWDSWAQSNGAKNLPDETISVVFTDLVVNNLLEFTVTARWTRRMRTREVRLTSRISRATEPPL